MATAHLIRRASEASYEPAGALAPDAVGYGRWSIVDDTTATVHTGFGVCRIEATGTVPAHVHSFEESVYVLEGEVLLRTPEASVVLRSGDYALVPIAVPHSLHGTGAAARWAEMLAPVPRAAHDADTFRVADLPEHAPVAVDPRDPRTRSFGSISKDHMDPSRQSQDLLAVSASMRTALLVYSGITVKMMVDADLGAVMSTMFMVQYEQGGAAGAHDHPLEETYLILEGNVHARFDDVTTVLKPGDVAWAGAGCVHAFSAPDGPVRWLETQAPQPPSRYSYRFVRDWDYLRERLDERNTDD